MSLHRPIFLQTGISSNWPFLQRLSAFLKTFFLLSGLLLLPLWLCAGSNGFVFVENNTLSASSNSPVCGGNDLLLFADGGTGYSWIGPGGFNSTQQNPVIPNVNPLHAGIYTVTVTNGGATEVFEVNVIVFPQMQLSYFVTNAACNSLGSIQIGATGGDGNYAFDWSDLSGNANPADRTDLLPGLYSLTVTDNSGCSVVENNMQVLDNCACNALAGTISVTSDLLCMQNPAILVSAFSDNNSFVPPGFQVIYLLSSEPNTVIQQSSTIPDFIVTVPTDYHLHTFVYDPATFNLNTIVFGTTTIFQLYQLLIEGGGTICGALDFKGTEVTVSKAGITIAEINPADCGLANGSAVLQPLDYSYSWSDGGTTAMRNDLLAGLYVVEGTDGNGCSASLEVLITEDCNNACLAPVVTDVTTSASLCMFSTGSAAVNVVGDPADFQFTWTPDNGTSGAANNIRNELPAGFYSVKITDPNFPDCPTEIQLLISAADGPVLDSLLITAAECGSANGIAMLFPQNFTYRWTFDNVVADQRDDLAPGIYEVVVTDANAPDCINVISVEIPSRNLILVATPVVLTAPTCMQSDGSVRIFVAGGSGIYSFSWGPSNIRNDLAAGLYSVTVTDIDNGCERVINFALANAVSGVNVDADEQVSTSCPGANDARADFFVFYQAGFVTPADTVISDGVNIYAADDLLSPGNYCLLIYDGNGCLADEDCFVVVDAQPVLLTIEVKNKSCAENGSVQVFASGGNGDFLFDWSDLPGNDNPQNRTDLAPGTYQLQVTDTNNCTSIEQTVTITDDCLQCPNPSTSLVVITPNSQVVQCAGLETCFDPAQTTFALANGTSTGQSVFGSWSIDAAGCLTYSSNDLLGIGLDTVCVIASFDALQDTTCFVFSIFTTPLSSAVTDTVYLTTFENQPVNNCLDLSELGNVFTDSEITIPPVNNTGNFTIANNCISYLPLPGILGDFVDTMQVVICNALVPICDTTVIIVSINPAPDCQPFFTQTDTLQLTADDCNAPTVFCLEGIPPFQMQFYTVQDNGTLISGPFSGCSFDTLYEYNLSQILTAAPTGPYELESWVVNGNTFSLATFQTFAELVAQMNGWDPTGNWVLAGNVIRGGSTATVYSDLDITSQIASIQDPIPLDPFFTANGTAIPLDTGFHEVVLIVDSTGCSDTLFLSVDCELCPIWYAGPDTLMADSCNGTALLCLDIPVSELLDYSFLDNGVAFAGSLEPCVKDTSYQYVAFQIGSPGIYVLESWVVNGQVFSIPLFTTVQQLADSMQVWDPAGNWQLFGFVLVGGAPGSTYSDLTISFGGNPPFMVPALAIPDASGLLLSVGTHEIEVINTISQCSATYLLEVRCDSMLNPNPGQDTLINIFVNTSDTLCFNLPQITSIENLCPAASDGNVTADWIAGTSCIDLSGLQLGADTFCIRYCDGAECDTLTVLVNVLPQIKTIPLLIGKGATDTFCLDTTIFQGVVDTVFNFCENASGTFVNFNYLPGTNCFEYTGLNAGTEPACLVVCDDLGFCDTTILEVTVFQPMIAMIDTTVLLGDLDTFCLDTSELSGPVDTFFNYCDRSSGLFVEFYLEDNSSLCVIYEGVALGSDTACLVICDTFGVCDTTFLMVTTIEPMGLLPIAVNDSASTTVASAVEISVLLNDILNGDLQNLVVIDFPTRGTVAGSGFNLVYLPDPGFCDGVDSFTYAIQNEIGWDTATVFIEVLCQDIKVFNGFSPNNDGVNDTFTILGIEQFPNNEVKIFNRWGNLVFSQKGYLNALGWEGTWKGQDLPDGTYFYLIDDGEGRVLNGYLQLLR